MNSEYIWSFTYLFNKKKFEKLLKWWKWDHEINLINDIPKELSEKTYAIMIREEESLNQWLDEQLKAGFNKMFGDSSQDIELGKKTPHS